MFVAELSALAAAFCRSFGGILATSPARAPGAITFNRIRMILVFFMLAIMAPAHGPAGLVSTLSATSPILILPVLWVVTRDRPATGAWLGAALAVAGAGCVFS